MVCGGGTVFCSALLPSFCVCCHSIVGLGLCLYDRVVSLWNRGDGLCGRKNGGGVRCPLSTLVCVVLWCACCLVVLWVAEWRWGEGVRVCGLVICLPLPLPLPLCVGVRGSARAAQRARTLSPNTMCSLVVLSSLLLVFLRAPPFLLLWNGGV